MKRTTMKNRLLALALCICMVLGIVPIMPLEVEAATTPTYISGIAVSYGTTASAAKNVLTGKGYTVINYDLNEDAGGRYIYMGFKTTTDPSQAITGIFFSSTDSDSHPNSKTFDGVTAYLLGGSTEANPGENTYVDLNKGAGGNYIYTYVTRDTSRAPIIAGMYFNTSSSASGYVTPNVNLNDDAGGDSIYLHYQQFSGNASSTFYYLTSGGSRTSYTTSVSVKNHTQSVSTTPSVSSTVTYDGRTFTFKGWREDNSATNSYVSPSYTYMTSKTYRAVYSATVTLSYNANGGSGAPSSQTATQYINAGSSSVSKTSHSFTIPPTKPTHDDSKCIYLGWSTSSTATSASYQPGQTISISSNTTLYAVWRGEHTAARTYVNNGSNHTYTRSCCGKSVTEAHSYTDGLCACGKINPDAVATLSKNGKVVGAYTTLNDAVQAVANCTASDQAMVTILKDINLGNSYQRISSGVFAIDLNGKTLSSTHTSYGVLYISGAVDVTVTDSGTGGTISGAYAGLELYSGPKLTITGGTISGNNRGVSASSGNTLSISGGSIGGGDYGVFYRDGSTLTISGGSISGGSGHGVCVNSGNPVTISGGSISGSEYGVYILHNSTVTISGGSISGEWADIYSYYDHIYRNFITLTLGDNGVGATFPGGITVNGNKTGTTLNEILGKGAAYWQGSTMILPANGATEISGGDVTIKAECKHDWQNATCTTPKTCSSCGATEGEALGHSWKDATCITSKTCSSCGATEGEALGHSWKDATCTTPKTCSGCGATEGEALGDHRFNEKGFCTRCETYQPCEGKGTETSPYLIDNAGKLYWFAAVVNGGYGDVAQNTAAHAKLTADITVNTGVLAEMTKDEPDPSGFRTWASIGNVYQRYTGTFDGNNKTVSGLYINDNKTGRTGLVGYMIDGTVQNVGVVDSWLCGLYIGGVVGYNDSGTVTGCYYSGSISGSMAVGGVVGFNNSGTVTGCYNTGSISCSDFSVGGVTGYNTGIVTDCYNTGSVSSTSNCVGGVAGQNFGTITDCWNSGTVSGSDFVGGVVGKHNKGTVANCYNIGAVSSTVDYVGGVAGFIDGTVENCYYLTDCATDGAGFIQFGIGNWKQGIATADVEGMTMAKNTDQFASGEVAYLLGEAFGQTIGEDAYPTLGGEKVYPVVNCKNEICGYSNTEGEALGHSWTDATCATPSVCTVCGVEGETDPNNHEYTYLRGKFGYRHEKTDACSGDTVWEAHSYNPETGCCNECGVQIVCAVVQDNGTIEYHELLEYAYRRGAKQLILLTDVTVPEGETWDFSAVDELMAVEGVTLTNNGTIVHDQWDKSCLEGMNNFYTGNGIVKLPYVSYVRSNGEWLVVECSHMVWQNATCVAPKTCKICGETEGELNPNAHTPDDSNVCTQCGVTMAPITVQGIAVTDKNASDVLGDLDEGATVTYDFETNTLTLNNAKLIGAVHSESEAYGIYSLKDLNLRINGENTVTTKDAKYCYGVCVKGNLYIAGGGTLELRIGGSNALSCFTAMAISADNLDIDSGTVTAVAGGAESAIGVDVREVISVSSGAVLNAVGGSIGVGLVAQSVECRGTVNALAGLVTEDSQSYLVAFGQVALAENFPPLADAYVVNEGATLTVNEGITLDMSNVTSDKIILDGTIVNNGTVILPDTYTYATIPTAITGGTVTIGGSSYIWNGSKYICETGCHSWTDATCTDPKTCGTCGETEGEALGHSYTASFNWSKYYTDCDVTLSCGCGSSYTDACRVTSTTSGSELVFTAVYDEYSDTVTMVDNSTLAIYFDNSNTKWDTVYAYCWNSDNPSGLAPWPGVPMTHVEGDLYAAILPRISSVVFTNGIEQSVDLIVPTGGAKVAVWNSASYIKWGYVEPEEYTITFEVDGETVDSFTARYGQELDWGEIDKNAAKPEKDGYRFAGYDYTNAPAYVDGDITVSGSWIKRCTVTYAGYGTEHLRSETVDANTSIQLPQVFLGRNPNGYVFMEFNTQPDGSGESYFEFDWCHVTEDVTLYARWAEIAVGGGYLNSGEYMDLQGNVTVTQPDGGYAYFDNGTLILHDFSYTGVGNGINHHFVLRTDIHYEMGSLNVVLEGENSLVNTAVEGYAITCQYDLNISGPGSLTASSNGTAIYTNHALCVQSSTLNLTGAYMAIGAVNGIILENAELLIPENGSLYFDGNQYYFVDGEGKMATSVVIAEAHTHTEETVPGKAPTCTETGLTDGVQCSACGEILVAQEEIPALGHSNPVYTNNGTTHSAVYPCCGETFARNEAHTYVDGLCVCGSKSNLRNGIYAEDGSLFYYRNGSRYYAGLIEIDGDYYYVRSNGELVHGRTYWTTKTNGLKNAANYYFDETGKLASKNGLVTENGGLYYYVDGKLNYAGLIEIDGDYYYIRSNGQAVTGQSYWITKTNDLKPAASYEFGADGKMVIHGTFVREADGIYYYVDGKRTYGGLIYVDGKYYYVRSNGQLVTDRSYWITKTNDLLPAANYSFDADGVMENPPA